jgi:hypothetical protein
MILYGGEVSTNTLSSNLVKFNLSSMSFTTITPSGNVPPPLMSHSMALSDDHDNIFIFGGLIDIASHTRGNDIYQYQVSASKWTLLTTSSVKPQVRTESSLVYFQNALYLYGGGQGTSNVFGDFWKFDLTRNNWTQLASPSFPGRLGHSAVVAGSTMLVFGGKENIITKKLKTCLGSKNLSYAYSDLYSYDFNSTTWQSLPYKTQPNDLARYDHTAMMIPKGDPPGEIPSTQMLVFGGCNNPNTDLNSLLIYDLVENDWVSSDNPTSPDGRSGHISGLLKGQNGPLLVVFGGANYGELETLQVTLPPNATESSSQTSASPSKSSSVALGVGLGVGLGVLFILCAIVIFFIYRVAKGRGKSTASSKPEKEFGNSPKNVEMRETHKPVEEKNYMLQDISVQSLIGKGNFGEVYLGNW